MKKFIPLNSLYLIQYLYEELVEIINSYYHILISDFLIFEKLFDNFDSND
jgi:hypothetical protein